MVMCSCQEKAQQLNEQQQLVLFQLLREEDRYYSNCKAKGPRWASWNIGVFICIKCARIHRNLGVHICRVKSFNLDQWTPEQIQKHSAAEDSWCVCGTHKYTIDLTSTNCTSRLSIGGCARA
ncbi:hypothetical protein GH733_008336 [Mirounga leonina]|nr:hypothetical protein GH733_008336 [Mirounga leonina]